MSSEALAKEDTLRRVPPKTQKGPRLLSRGAPPGVSLSDFLGRPAFLEVEIYIVKTERAAVHEGCVTQARPSTVFVRFWGALEFSNRLLEFLAVRHQRVS